MENPDDSGMYFLSSDRSLAINSQGLKGWLPGRPLRGAKAPSILEFCYP